MLGVAGAVTATGWELEAEGPVCVSVVNAYQDSHSTGQGPLAALGAALPGILVLVT